MSRNLNDTNVHLSCISSSLNYNKQIVELFSRITVDPEICHGKPCIRNMRWPIEIIIDMVDSGMSIAEIIEEHAELEKEDILACLNFTQ